MTSKINLISIKNLKTQLFPIVKILPVNDESWVKDFLEFDPKEIVVVEEDQSCEENSQVTRNISPLML